MKNPASDFWAITAYFNLTNGQRRRRNYNCFRQQLSVPLLTVEWSPDGDFHLQAGDADVLVQVGGGDLMWQKERLLTLAAAALPEHVKYIAWIDCDVLFEDPDWAFKAKELLARKSVIQLFSEAAFADAHASLRMLEAPVPRTDLSPFRGVAARTSFLAAFAQVKEGVVGLDLGRRFKREIGGSANIMQRPSHGLAWAAQASFLRDLGLYDRCIIGAGDVFFAYAITGLTRHLLESQQQGGWAFYGDNPSYGEWSLRAAEMCAGQIGCLDGRVAHLFHGDMGQRQYTTRVAGLVPFALDLDRDITAPDDGPWSWKRDRNALNAYFLRYLHDRNEDGLRAAEVGAPANT
jgi:hypothetical protein